MATAQEILAIKARLDETEKEMKVIKESLMANTKATIAQTEATESIARNTAPLLELYQDLAAGTKFLCRCAMGVQWSLEMINKYYKSMLILAAILWAITHNFQLPAWV